MLVVGIAVGLTVPKAMVVEAPATILVAVAVAKLAMVDSDIVETSFQQIDCPTISR